MLVHCDKWIITKWPLDNFDKSKFHRGWKILAIERKPMLNNQDLLKSMLQDIINDKMEQASVTMHEYFVAKTREVSGFASPPDTEDTEDTELDK